MGKPRTAECWPRSDPRPIVAKLVEATFSSWACSWGPGGCFVVCWLVDSLYPPPNWGLERTSRFQRWHRPSKDLFRGVVSGVWRFFFFFFFFFFVRTTIVASLDWQQDVQCSKVRLLAERSWTDDMQGPWAFPSNVRSLRAGRPHNLPQVRFLSLQVFVMYCANATTKPVLARTSTSVPRTRSSNSFLELVPRIVQRICLHSDTHRQSHWKGSYDHSADSFSQSPMFSATRSPKQASEGAQKKHPNKESISINYSCRS